MGFTEDQILEMTFGQIRRMIADPDELEQSWRWKHMTPQAREKAREIKRKYGRF